MNRELLLLLIFAILAGLTLLARKSKNAIFEQIVYYVGLGTVAFTWVIIVGNFYQFVLGWRNYQPHAVIKQAEQSNITLRILAPLFDGIFSIGPAMLPALLLTGAAIIVGIVCLMQFPPKPLMPIIIATINVLFVAFAIKSYDQLITYLPYTMDRVIGTLILFLAYAASLVAQLAAAVFEAPRFRWMDTTVSDEIGRIKERPIRKTPPMQPARMVLPKKQATANE